MREKKGGELDWIRVGWLASWPVNSGAKGAKGGRVEREREREFGWAPIEGHKTNYFFMCK